MSARIGQARERFLPILLCITVYDGLLFSLVGLNHDFSEWVKLGIMDEADRLDRHWASWTIFSQASFVYSGSVLLIIFISLDRMCAGLSTLEETFALQNQSAHPCLTLTLSTTK